MKILVTGANGQLGNEIKERSDLLPNAQFIFIDIENLDLTDAKKTDDYIKETNPDFIINCAAYTAVDKAEEEIEKAYLANTHAPEYLALAAKKTGSKIIHISTDYVYAGDGNIPLKETVKADPKSVYGKSKLKGEKRLLKNCEPIVIRTSWLYSSYGNNFIKTIMKYGKEREELRVVFDQTGTPTFAGDLAIAVLQIIKQTVDKDVFHSGIYNYSNEGVCSWYDLAVAIKEYIGLTCRILPIETHEYPLPAPRPQYSVLNKTKIKNTFSLEIPYWKDSLVACLDRIKDE